MKITVDPSGFACNERGFTCGSKITEDGRRLVGLHISNHEGTRMLVFDLQPEPVPESVPIPDDVLERHYEIVPGDDFLQVILDHAWAVGLRPSADSPFRDLSPTECQARAVEEQNKYSRTKVTRA